MSTPFVGEIRLFGFRRVPTGWQACDGSLLSIAEYEVLYTLIGTTYGGDGQTTFAVPDLRGRLPLHQGSGPALTPRVLGEIGGTETVTVLTGQMPGHNHTLLASAAAATAVAPGPQVIAGALTGDTFYITDLTGATAIPMAANALQMAGGTGAHDNLMPTLTMNLCIAWAGIFPQQS